MTTQNYARTGADNIVIETWRAPDDLDYLTPAMLFVPEIAAQFVPCPDEVLRDWVYDPITQTYSPPQEP